MGRSNVSSRKSEGTAPGRVGSLGMLAVIALFASFPVSVQAQGYNLSLLTQLGDTIDGRTITSFLSDVSLNDNGTVAFLATAEVIPGNTPVSLFTQNNLIAAPGSVVDGFTLDGIYSGQTPALSNSGEVLFGGFYDQLPIGTNLPGIFTQNSPRALTEQDAPVGVTHIISPQSQIYGMNKNGEAAFYAVYENPDTTTGSGLLSETGVLVSLGDTIGGLTLDTLPIAPLAFNNAGTVAFVGQFQVGPILRDAIFTQNSLLLREFGNFVDDSLIENIFPGSRLSMNNAGTVVTRVTYTDDVIVGGQALVTQNNFLVKGNFMTTIGGRIITSLTSFETLQDSSPAINDDGTVVFLADSVLPGNVDNRRGLFTQSGVVALSSAIVGGKTLATNFLTSSPAINNDGVIAFIANFTDGSSGIVLATPTAQAGAPEPGSVLLMLGGIVGILTRHWRGIVEGVKCSPQDSEE